MPLSAKTQQFMTSLAANETLEAQGAFLSQSMKAGEVPQLHKIQDRTVPGPAGELPVRIYTPVESATPLPVVVFFHGGAFIVGDLDMYDRTVRLLSRETGYIFVSVQYRLAPTSKYPAAVEDSYAATAWVHANAATLNADPARFILMGDSSGGSLAATIALMARDRGTPSIDFQVLIYPTTAHPAAYDEFESWKTYNGYIITREGMEGAMSAYLPEPTSQFIDDPYVTFLKATNFKGLAPAFIITAECDPLRDEAESCAALLKTAGVPVVLSRYDGTIHGFLGLPFEAADVARKQIAHVLKSYFKTGKVSM
ncbi:lipase/esterase [Endogone sp. FLAS-F59071]|nr:lipase/esterase [Endogone sp. FLAS-F59071]|eukprot:RUS14193.1 lipase/esterase [Endogone sp. FLAS-F59071]